ncbi:excalibur calcium-binding domain-containing protein [Oceanobacillus jeddahense]|uniref:Excalibur calcium-binding domain-containing protein n=1 Tax=Oceanobacillus jeddahense TaxID=1462527 RepID=A0ABY5JQD8_9BACI|nr:excalibur calcium-binding domain-containing protein [Oceanobacillus jeddahense]UUI02533.1 excalibur calcium-binding domain-containing protein [Oceanobacillus jeddahense]
MKGTRLTLAAFFSILLMFGTAQSVFAADSLNCSDFDTQQEAQEHYDKDPSDPDGLDRDNDGIACESLPGGDSTSNDSGSSESTNNESEESEDTSADESNSSDAASEEDTTSSNENGNSEESDSSSESATTEEPTSSDEEGGDLPNTATVLPLSILGGLGAMILGGLGLRKRQ